MCHIFIRAALILALPIVVFVVGGWIISKISNRTIVDRQLASLPRSERVHLNRRFGYDFTAVRRYWDALDADARNAERSFLKLDLVFPVFYGAALAAGLLMAWALLGKPFPAWLASLLLAPVAATVLADWIENLVHLKQLGRYGDRLPLESHPIRIASKATVLKLVFFAVSLLLLVAILLAALCAAGAAGPA